jgi:hypothetical protein
MDVSIEERKEKRLSEFKDWLATFKEYYRVSNGVEIIYIDDAEEILNDWYWYKIEEGIYPFMEKGNQGKINHSKIISGKELSIVAIQPIISENNRALNAELAWFIAWSILSGWNDYDTTKINLVQEDSDIQLFIKEHLTWLEKLAPEFEYPLFSNAQTWRVFQMFVSERLKNIA